MKDKDIPISEFRDKFEYKMSKLSDEKLERLQKIIIKSYICFGQVVHAQ